MKKWSKAGMVCAAILAAGMAVTACGGGNTAKTDNTGAVETEKRADGSGKGFRRDSEIKLFLVGQ